MGVEDRQILLQHLSRAGWNVESWAAPRDAGVRVDLSAEAEYGGPSLVLRLELPFEQRYLVFQMSRLDGELVSRLHLYPSGDLIPVLRQIIAVQDTLDEENHPQLVKSLISLSDPLLIETDSGLYRLT